MGGGLREDARSTLMDSKLAPPAQCFLGVDGGGTKTAWAIVGASGGVLHAGERAVGLQLATMGTAHVADALRELLAMAQRAAPARVAGVVAGIAGAGSAAARRELASALAARGVELPVVVVGDAIVAGAAALADGPGVAVWAGTGSFAIARDAAGGLRRVGGRGWLLGDQGSAFDLARRGAAAAIAAIDGLGPATTLTAAFPRACGLRDASELGRYLQGVTPGALAAHCGLVGEARDEGDAVATALVADCARALTSLALAAADRAGLPTAALRVVMGGGLLQRDAGLRALVGAELAACGVTVPPSLCATSGAVGAARLAQARVAGTAPMHAWVSDDGAV